MNMFQKRKLRVGIDFDDILGDCVAYAISLANEKYQFSPPITVDEITRWGKTGNRTDVIFEFFSKLEFWESQPIFKKAKFFIRELSKIVEVFCITAIEPKFMPIRVNQILTYFPEIPPENIIMSARKELVELDVLLDDNPNNILSSKATFPVIMKKPWNSYLTGMLSVNTYCEFLKLIDMIIDSKSISEPNIIALIGPSGSNKNKIASFIAEQGYASRLESYTTNSDNEYHKKITKKEFLEKKADFFEYSVYGTHLYGLKKEDVYTVIDENKKAVVVIDICGAITLKQHFKDTVLVYIKSSKEEMIQNILSKSYSIEEKTNRLLFLEHEMKNEWLCDYVLEGNESENIIKILETIKS